MKKLFFAIALLFSLLSSASAQMTVTKSADGTYQEVKVPATVESLTKGASKTDAVLVTKAGERLPVYLSKGGKAFVVKVSAKTGNPYRRYLTEVETGTY